MPTDMIESARIHSNVLTAVTMFCHEIPLEKRVNFDRVSTMLRRCQQFHPACRTDNGLGFPQNARVVDCETRRVVPMVEGLPYIALSYVWGTPNDAAGTRRPEKPTLSDCLPPVVPQMIEDALGITVRLAYRYLWIDFFCIDQCHSTEKAFQIQQMGNIYSHASATICALSAHPDLGLPGISRSRPISESFRSQDVTYICLPEPGFLQQSLRDSAWISRGWTFQEAVLSRRCLFFTDDQVSLVCHASHQTETISQLVDGLWGSNIDIATAILGGWVSDTEVSFDIFVNQYQTRHLSYESDTLDAFTGLLSLAPTQSYFGILLPLSFKQYMKASIAFAYGLLWRVNHIREHPQELRAKFPSWSWISRKGIGISFVGVRRPYEELRYKQPVQRALCMWVECSESTWVATICTNTPNSDSILIDDLFHRYKHLKVVPQESNLLRLESFTATYQILQIHHPGPNGRREYADVKMQASNNRPFEWPNPNDAERDRWYDFDKSYVKYLYDDISSLNDPGKDSHLAILLIDNAIDGWTPKSYWLALRPAYVEDVQSFFYREGIIKICERLKWKENWESVPRNEIWLI
jgi:hypothetical protein